MERALVHDRAGGSPSPHDPRPYFSVAEVARLFGMSEMTVYRAIGAGEFPAIKIRGRLIVPARAIDAMTDAAVRDQTLVDAADWVPAQRAFTVAAHEATLGYGSFDGRR